MDITNKILLITAIVILGGIFIPYFIHLSKQKNEKKYNKFAAVTLIGVILAGTLIWFLVKKPSDETTTGNHSTNGGNTTTGDKKSTDGSTTGSTSQENNSIKKDTIKPSSYIAHDNNTYEIKYNNSTLGFIKLPPKTTAFVAYLQNGISTAENSSNYLEDTDTSSVNMVDKETFLNGLGRYIIIAKQQNKRLILSVDDGTNLFMKNNEIKFGKDINNMKLLKLSKMRHPNGTIYNITGWLDY